MSFLCAMVRASLVFPRVLGRTCVIRCGACVLAEPGIPPLSTSAWRFASVRICGCLMHGL
eukprot:2299824-Amphidinium_carterae.1